MFDRNLLSLDIPIMANLKSKIKYLTDLSEISHIQIRTSFFAR